MSKMNQSSVYMTPKVPPAKATGHVDRYITIGNPSYDRYMRLTIDEAKQLRKELAEAIKTAGE